MLPALPSPSWSAAGAAQEMAGGLMETCCVAVRGDGDLPCVCAQGPAAWWPWQELGGPGRGQSHGESPNWAQGAKPQMRFPPWVLLSPSPPATAPPHHAGCGLWVPYPSPKATRVSHRRPLPRPRAVPLPIRDSYLLLALLLQVELDLEGLARFEEGFAVLAVSHVVGHGAHRDGAKVDGNVGQDLWGRRKGDGGEQRHGEARARPGDGIGVTASPCLCSRA